MKNLLVVLGIMGLLVMQPVLAAAPVQGDLEENLQADLDAFLAANDMAPGLAVYAVCPQLGLAWEGASGTIAHGNNQAMTARHTCRIASNTKTYVATAVLRLVETGRLDLNDTMVSLLTADQVAMLEQDGYLTNQMTLQHVLSHTAGLAHHTSDPRFVEKVMADVQHSWTSEEQLGYLVQWCDPLGQPGEKYIYSDSGYVLLGTILTRLTGKTLGPAVRELVDFDGLGLQTTYWEYMEDAPANMGPTAHQYYGEMDVTDWNLSFDLHGGGGIVTDARELTLFMRHLLKGQVLEKESTLAAMTGRGTETYRLGLMVMETSGFVAFGHQGYWNTFAYHVPSLDLTIGGTILNHEAANGWQLFEKLTATVATAAE